MHRRKSFALLGATGGAVALTALAALGSSAAGKQSAGTVAAGGIPVTVRIEGDSKTLLPTTKVSPGAAPVRKGAHSCPGNTAAGALNVATHGRWSGKWYSGLGFEVVKIDGENDAFTTTHSYWELFVNNVASSVGMCSEKLHRGDQILFAAVAAKGTEYPLVLTVLTKPRVGKPFKVKVVYFKGHTTTPLAGAMVTGKGSGVAVAANTDEHGIATLSLDHAGQAVFTASKKHYIRAASVSKDVAP